MREGERERDYILRERQIKRDTEMERIRGTQHNNDREKKEREIARERTRMKQRK